MGGQTFSWTEEADGVFSATLNEKVYRIRDLKDAENDEYLRSYFDLDYDYEKAMREIAAKDEVLRSAVEKIGLLRILKQDHFIATISFILSQNNNIKRIKGLYVRIIAKNPGDYVEATFDRFEYSDNRKVIESNINAPLKLSAASFKPQSLDKNVISFLNYKTVVAKGITVKQLKDSVKLDDKYALAVVDKNGKEIADDETVKTGMWLVVKYKKTEVSMYYIEIGNPIDISGIEDVPMPGRPLMLSAENNSGKLSGNGVKNINTVLVIIIAAVCLAAAGTASFIVIKHKKDKSQKNISNE